MAWSEVVATTRPASVLVGIAFAALACAASAAARAQSLGDFEQRGIRLGAVDVFSQFGFTTLWDDNVFAVPDDGITVGNQTLGRESDFLFVARPQVRLQSNTQRHAFFLTGRAALGRYDTFSSQDYNDWTVEGGGRWDVTRTFNVNAVVGYDNLHESATDPDRRTLRQTTDFERFRGSLTLNQRWQRSFVRFNSRVTATRYQEVDVAGINVNSGRDVDRLFNSLRLGYRPGRDYDLFVELRRAQADFDNTAARNRDQQTWGVRVGTTLDIDRLVTGEVSAGVDRTTFDDGNTPIELGFSLDAGLDWTLTPTTVLSFGARQTIEPSDTLNNSARQETDLDVTLSRALSRKLAVNAVARYQRDDFLESDRLDETYGAGVGARYSFNRYLSLQGGYDYEQRDSTVTAREYSRNQIFFTLLGRY